MKKLFLIFNIFIFTFISCSDFNKKDDINYVDIVNNSSLSKKDKCNKVIENFILENEIKTAISVGIKSNNFEYFNYHGFQSIKTKEKCDSTSLQYIYSITKTFISALTLRLYEKNILDIDKSIDFYIPELFCREIKDEKKDLNLYIDKDATIRELLNHTSGIADYAKNFKLYNTKNSIFEDKWNPVNILDFIENTKNNRGIYNYSTTNYVLLGIIIEKVTQEKLNCLIKNFFSDSLNLDSIFLTPQDNVDYLKVSHPHIYPNTDFNLSGDGKNPIDITLIIKRFLILLGKASWAGGGIVSNSKDISKWGYELYSDNGKAVSKNLRNLLYKSVSSEINEKEDIYGLGVRKIKYKNYDFIGSYGRGCGSENLLYYNKDFDASFCILSNCNMKNDKTPNIDELLFWLFECVK